MIKNFKPRLYQETIFATAAKQNTLVVLPTGMGKTNIFLMLAAHRLKLYPNSKILLLGPTRPLIDQYYKVFLEHFDISEKDMAVFTGFVSPEKRAELWKSAKIIFSTPQGLENDIISNKIKLEEVSLLGFDEAHRATGDYAYVFIAKQYYAKARYPRIIALTASPGSDVEKINEIVNNLYIEDVEIRTEESPDVKQYMQEVDVHWVMVDFPQEFREVHGFLKKCFNSKIEEIKKLGYISDMQLYGQSKKDLLGLQARLQGELASGNRDLEVMRAVSVAAEAMKVQHAIELIETQGIMQLNRYMEQIENQSKTSKVKAVQNLVRDINFRMALVKAKTLGEKNIEHPKLVKLAELVRQNNSKKMIIFTQYRDSGQGIVQRLEGIEGIKAKLFVGQAKKNDTGLTQKRQIEILDEFRNDLFNVLVATSVGEEGLDIPQVDIVIFYEPIPSEIRHIQRKGRTGRLEKGQVIILSTKDTRDEAYRWSAHHKEKRMHRNLESLKKRIVFKNILAQHSTEKPQSGQEMLGKYTQASNSASKAGISSNQDSSGRNEKTENADSTNGSDNNGNKNNNQNNKPQPAKVFADYREKGSGAIKELVNMGINLQLEKLDSADYICSSRCGIEFKTQDDFVDSLIDGRLLQQIKALKQNFEKPLIIVEGSGDLYSIRNVHANAIRGLLATISVSYGIPVMYTKNPQDTAALIAVIAKREQEETGKDFSLHTSFKPMSTKESQEYVVSALPGVGAGLAKELLKKFGSVKKIVNASEEELKEADKIGEKKAKKIKEIVDAEYE
jgi:ERCC4-related helicase/ERCC4-type nuclease